MSAENIYQPHVWIAGRMLSEASPAEDLAAVARLKINWGASDWFANVEPGTLTATIIDPYGDFLSTGQGAPIEVTRDPDDTPVFDGSIDEITSRYIKTTDPRNGETRHVWQHDVKASDPLGALARDRRRGPVYADPRATIKNMHWGNCYMIDRRNDLTSRSPVPIRWPATILDYTDEFKNTSQFMLFPPIVGYLFSETVSALTVLRNTARAISAFARPYYDPSTREIRFVEAGRVMSMLQNAADTPMIYLEEKDEFIFGKVELLYAGELQNLSGVETATGSREQVTRAEITTTMPQLERDESGRIKVAKTAMPVAAEGVPKAGSQLTVQVESDICFEFLQDEHSEGLARWTTESELKGGATEIISRAFNQPKIAPLVYRFKKHQAAPDWAIPFLTPVPPRSPTETWTQRYRLIESLTNLIPGTSTFGIVGGAIEYAAKTGWTVTLNPAMCEPDTLSPTLGEILSANPLNRVSDNSTVADWQHLQFAN